MPADGYEKFASLFGGGVHFIDVDRFSLKSRIGPHLKAYNQKRRVRQRASL